MALTKKDKQQIYMLVIVLAIAAAAGFWYYIRAPLVEEQQRLTAEADSLRRQIDSARADLREGTVEQLRQRVAVFERSLALMRLLVPTDNEVANLIDQVSTQAQLRGVTITDINPLSSEIEVPFEVYRYRFTVRATYDELGEFLADIGSLERIIVPYDVGLDLVNDACPGVAEGSTCVQATFLLRTFVKSPNASVMGGGVSEAR